MPSQRRKLISMQSHTRHNSDMDRIDSMGCSLCDGGVCYCSYAYDRADHDIGQGHSDSCRSAKLMPVVYFDAVSDWFMC